MELRHLRYFIAVAEEQNITRAAKRLHVSQPPLSRQIRDLESSIGAKLFDRGGKSIRLTEAGRLFLMEARSVLQRADEATELIRAVALGRRGQVRVGYATSPTVEILPRALRIFLRSHPHVRVHLREMTTQGMLNELRARTLDAAMIVSISPSDFEGLTTEELGRYSIRVAVHKKHRFARMKEVTLKEVAREPLIMWSRRDYPEAHAGLAKILSPYTRAPKIVDEYDTVMSLIAAVEAGRGAALVFQSLSLIAGQRVILRPLNPSPPPLPIAIAYRPDEMSAATAAFVEAAKAARVKQDQRHPLTALQESSNLFQSTAWS